METLHNREPQEKSLTEQADAIRASLTGLSDEDRTLLDRGRVFDAANRAVQSWKDGVSSFSTNAVALQSTIQTYLSQTEPPPPEPEMAILAAAYAEHRRLLDDANLALEPLIIRAATITAGSRPAFPA